VDFTVNSKMVTGDWIRPEVIKNAEERLIIADSQAFNQYVQENFLLSNLLVQ
jgi:hypothetical protein